MKLIENKSVVLSWVYLQPFCTITISEMARLRPIDNAMPPPPADTNIDDINDKNVFLNDFVNDIANKSSAAALSSRPWQRTLKLKLTENSMNMNKPLPLPVDITDIHEFNSGGGGAP